MKKFIVLMILIISISTIGCSNNSSSIDIEICIPAGSQEEYVFSSEIISPKSDILTISTDETFVESDIILKTIKVTEENAYEPKSITSSENVEIEVEKDAWFRIGISTPNNTEDDILLHITVEDVVIIEE